MSGSQNNVVDLESAVRQRYSLGAKRAEADLCCPTAYDPKYLEAIPQEVLERDYGCGDPSRYLREGETVLDLGSGTGKICFIASQIVGPLGKVVGVDMNDDMLSIARRNAPEVARRVGYSNVDSEKPRSRTSLWIWKPWSVGSMLIPCAVPAISAPWRLMSRRSRLAGRWSKATPLTLLFPTAC
jgi:SAM-dependent methyltransferase